MFPNGSVEICDRTVVLCCPLSGPRSDTCRLGLQGGHVVSKVVGWDEMGTGLAEANGVQRLVISPAFVDGLMDW